MALRYKPQHNTLYKDKRGPGLRERVFLTDNCLCQWPGCGKLVIGKGREADNAPVAHNLPNHAMGPEASMQTEDMEFALAYYRTMAPQPKAVGCGLKVIKTKEMVIDH